MRDKYRATEHGEALDCTPVKCFRHTQARATMNVRVVLRKRDGIIEQRQCRDMCVRCYQHACKAWHGRIRRVPLIRAFQSFVRSVQGKNHPRPRAFFPTLLRVYRNE